jgi:redox-sensing transcriptional repressor
MKKIAENSIKRLIVYKKELNRLKADGKKFIYSHTLAILSGSQPHLVRRDLMSVGYSGSPAHGYSVNDLESSISDFLCTASQMRVILIGTGNLGRAIFDYCNQKNPKISITAAFDIDPNKINREYHGVYCFHIDTVRNYVIENDIKVAIITVPATEAQSIASTIVGAGIRGILNFTPVRLHLPDTIYIENADMMLSLEKVIYFVQNV